MLDSCGAEHRWLKRRESRVIHRARIDQSDISLLDFLDDRWVVSVPSNGPPIILDTRENPPKLCKWTSRSFQYGAWRPIAAVDPHQGDIIIAARM